MSNQPVNAIASDDSHRLPVVQHYHLLTYPFHHPFHDVATSEISEMFRARWKHWWTRLPHDPKADGLIRTLDDSYFFVPHVRELLFPETKFIPPGAAAEELRAAVELLQTSEPTLLARLPVAGVRRWRLADHVLDDFRTVEIHGLDNFGAQFHIDWVDMALFPQGTGFLILKVAINLPESASHLEISRINDFLYNIRILQPFSVGWPLPTWHAGSQRFLGLELIDYLLQEVSIAAEQKSVRAEDKLESYLKHAPLPDSPHPFGHYTQTTFGQTYGSEFNVFSYVQLDDGIAAPHLGERTDSRASSGFFLNTTERAIYELASFTDTENPDFVPHPAAVDTWRRDACVHPWANWLGSFSQEHILFVGFGKSRWTDHVFPHIVQSDYYTLFLLTLFQKININFLLPEVLQRRDDLTTDLDEVRGLVRGFLQFQCRYWVTEATRKPQGKLLYAAFQKSLGAGLAYDELQTRMEDIQRFYEGSYQRKINDLLLLLAIAGLPIALLGAMFGPTILAKVPKAVWMLLIQHKLPQVSHDLETEKSNALAWLVFLLAPSIIFVFFRWIRLRHASKIRT